MAIQHADSAHIHKFAYVQSGDPGAIGAGKGWVDTSNPTYVLKVRNGANNGWVNVGVMGTSIVGSVANSVALLQRTRWNVTDSSETILAMPAGKNAIINRIVLTSIGDSSTDLGSSEVWFESGGQNLTGQVFDRASVFWSDFAKGQGLAGPGYSGGLFPRYDPDTGFIYEFGILEADIVAFTDYVGGIPHEIDVFVFGTFIDNIL